MTYLQTRFTESPVAASLDCLVLDHFNPVAIRIQDESNVLHPSIGETLLPVHVQ